MNIFVTDPCPHQSAIWLDDKRVKHMPRECIEMFAIMLHSLTGKYPFHIPLFENEFNDRSARISDELYNHPCSRWIRKDIKNAWWLFRHMLYMMLEYEYRYNQSHPNRPYAQVLMKYIPEHIKPTEKHPKKFRNSSIYKESSKINIFDCYKETMRDKWLETDKVEPIWTKRNRPEWINISFIEYKSNQLKLELEEQEELPF